MIFLVLQPTQLTARDIAFEERVRAQEAIERVYYSHQIGATRPFDDAVSRTLTENKVRTYLKESVALQRFWSTAITAEMLRREAERIARQTHMPLRLKELYRTLGNDPVLIQECLARPLLVHRLVRDFYDFDGRFHADIRRLADSQRANLESGSIDPWSAFPGRVVFDLVRGAPGTGDIRGGAVSARASDPPVLDLTADEFDSSFGRLWGPVGRIGSVIERRDKFSITIPLQRLEGRVRVAEFTIEKRPFEAWWRSIEGDLDPLTVVSVAQPEPPMSGSIGSEAGGAPRPGALPMENETCSDDTWDNGSLNNFPPSGRADHAAVWTGSLMLIWGGQSGGMLLDSGARYDPATDTWSPMSQEGAPSRRSGHAAVWTGQEMIVWGGYGGSAPMLNTGARYDPVRDAWMPMSTTGAPSPRANATFAWTGDVMVIWGGYAGAPVAGPLGDGGRYDPTSDTWAPMTGINAPLSRWSATATWTGQVVIVWGGSHNDTLLNTGGRYDPSADTWLSTSTLDAPSPRRGYVSTWDGRRFLIWGGAAGSFGPFLNTGGRYDPTTDRWQPINVEGAPAPRSRASAVWTGRLWFVWGGAADSFNRYFDTGGSYDPDADAWTPVTNVNAPFPRAAASAVWTGRHVIVWGGMHQYNNAYTSTGGRYDPVADAWTPTSVNTAPQGRIYHSSIWTGNVMMVWGGYDGGTYLRTGGRYDPVVDSWTPTSTVGAPSARVLHSAVWTGREMVVWGGRDSGYPDSDAHTGGRYDPISDVWTDMSTQGVPVGRTNPSAIWTGDRMVVWGGLRYTNNAPVALGDGGRYDPVSDSWAPMSTAGAPAPRSTAQTAWTGTEMIVWGGGTCSLSGCFGLAGGGRYDPSRDVWAPMSQEAEPSPRSGARSTWTGSELFVWGGYADGEELSTGSRYDPVLDAWRSVSSSGAPSARDSHAIVWTGQEALVWGGYDEAGPANTGARYDPKADTWRPMSTAGAPGGRYLHRAVWTGRLMVVWAGQGDRGVTSTGGRYCACQAIRYYEDADGDGFGNPDASVMSCTHPEGYVSDATDCDDHEPATHPGGLETCDGKDNDCDGTVDNPRPASASCNDDDPCTIDACASGGCTHAPAISAAAVCSASPQALNPASEGRGFSLTLSLTDRCSGFGLDASLLSPIYVAGVTSPTLGRLILLAPDSGEGCTQDGIWETLTSREVISANTLEVHFLNPSDGLCSTLDGNRQDILALLETAPAGEQVQILFASSYPEASGAVECRAAVTLVGGGRRQHETGPVRPPSASARLP